MFQNQFIEVQLKKSLQFDSMIGFQCQKLISKLTIILKMQDHLMEHQSHTQSPKCQLSPLQTLINKVNGQGKYQFISFLIYSFMWFLTSWLLLGMGFFFDNSFTCNNAKYPDQQSCSQWVCSNPSQADRHQEINWHPSSIVFQFDRYLICPDHENTVSVLQAMLFVGAIFGFFVIPYIADNYGRRLGIRVAWAIGTIAVLITCLADSPNMIGLGLFLIGFGTNPGITLCLSFINEVCLGKSRQRFCVGVQVAFALGQTTIAFIFQADMTWRQIMYILFGLFCVGMFLIIFLIDQTPMFVIKKNPEEAMNILNRMAVINHKPLISLDQVKSLNLHEQETHQLHPQQKSLGFLDLFKYPSIRWTSISAAMIFFGIQAMYYSSQLNQSSVGFEKTINQIIFGVSQMIGYLSAELIIDKCLRKKATFIGLGISSSMCLVLGILVLLTTQGNKQAFKWIQTAGLMINRFVLCSFWSVFYVFVAELYPTQIRSMGFGWTSVVGMIGSTISPFTKQIAELVNLNSWFPPAIFGLIALCFTFCLKQTQGLALRDVIEERLQTLKQEKKKLDIDDDPDDEDFKGHTTDDRDSNIYFSDH